MNKYDNDSETYRYAAISDLETNVFSQPYNVYFCLLPRTYNHSNSGKMTDNSLISFEIEFDDEYNSILNNDYLNSVDTILPAAAFSMILREIAIELDKKYKDHIEKSPEIYVISMLDGRITKANKAHIKNYRNFAAFRSVSDAKIACTITRDILKEMFKSGK